MFVTPQELASMLRSPHDTTIAIQQIEIVHKEQEDPG